MSVERGPHSAEQSGFFGRHGCLIQGWVVGWAACVFLSAAVRTLVVERYDGIGTWAGAVFRTADAVPPGAKLALGGLLALALMASRAFGVQRDRGPSPLLASILATVAALAAAFVLPVSYYPPGDPAGWGVTAGHLSAAALAGAILWQVARSCRRRKARRDPGRR